MERVFLIVNSNAAMVSPRRREVIVEALSADFKLDVADTTGRNHASDLAREAVADGAHAVLAFGGDGTVNEVAQGLVHSDSLLGILPGGTTNVMARSLGMPTDIGEAVAYVAARVRTGSTRRINVGKVRERFFLFSAGMGIDADVVRRIESDPSRKKRWGEWAFLASALRAAFTEYRGRSPEIEMEVDGNEPVRVVLCVCCNTRPLTYFKRFPVDACPQATLDDGLDLFGITRVRTITMARIAWAVFVTRSHVRWRTSRYFHDSSSAVLKADRPMPVQADGDYLGEWSDARLTLERDALEILV